MLKNHLNQHKAGLLILSWFKELGQSSLQMVWLVSKAGHADV